MLQSAQRRNRTSSCPRRRPLGSAPIASRFLPVGMLAPILQPHRRIDALPEKPMPFLVASGHATFQTAMNRFIRSYLTQLGGPTQGELALESRL